MIRKLATIALLAFLAPFAYHAGGMIRHELTSSPVYAHNYDTLCASVVPNASYREAPCMD